MTNEIIISEGYNSLTRDCTSKLDTPLATVIIDGVKNVVECCYCHKKFFKKSYEIKRTKNHYCSLECFNKSKFKPNKIKINDDYAEIIIINRKGQLFKVLIDLEDVAKIKNYNWRLIKGYVTADINNKTTLLHRFILNPPEYLQIDHINMNKLDNRKANLKICTHLENAQNKHEYLANSTTGVRGVYFNKNTKKYVVHCQINKKRKYLGTYTTLNEAKLTRIEYERENGINE